MENLEKTKLEKLQSWEQMYGFVKDYTDSNPSTTMTMNYEDILKDEDKMLDYFIEWLADDFEGEWEEE